MKMKKIKTKQIRIPGPTPMPPEVVRSINREVVSHRSREFEKLLFEIEEKLKKVLQTKNDILIFASSGTGGMESAIVNLFSPKEKVLIVNIGEFGKRFVQMANIFNLKVCELKFCLGESADADKIKSALCKNKDITKVIVTHNETSTGVVNNLYKISKVVKKENRFLIVDAVSSVGAVDLPVDELEIDVVIAASQKAFMSPPGLSMIAVSKKAWVENKKSTLQRFYFDWKIAKNYSKKGQTPFTPALTNLFGLNKALDLILKEGIKNVFERHRLIGEYTRKRISEVGLDILARDNSFASNTITVAKIPKEIKANQFIKNLKNKYGVVIANGQGEMKDKVIRIAHMGFVKLKDMEFVCDAIAEELMKYNKFI